MIVQNEYMPSSVKLRLIVDDGNERRQEHALQWPKAFKSLILRDDVNISAETLAILNGEIPDGVDLGAEVFFGLSGLDLAMIFRRYDVVSYISKKYTSAITFIYEGNNAFNGFYPSHFAAFAGDYRALSIIADVCDWNTICYNQYVGYSSEPNSGDRLINPKFWYPGYAALAIAFISGHHDLFTKLFLNDSCRKIYDSYAQYNSTQMKIKGLSRVVSCMDRREEGSPQSTWGTDKRVNEIYTIVTNAKTDIDNIVMLCFSRGNLSQYVPNRQLRMLIACKMLCFLNPEFNLDEASKHIWPLVFTLSSDTQACLAHKLEYRVERHYARSHTNNEGLNSKRVLEASRRFLRRRPCQVTFFASDYVVDYMAGKISSSNFTFDELDRIFDEFVNPNIRAINAITTNALRGHLDEVAFDQLHKYTVEAREAKKTLLLECLTEKLPQSITLTREKITLITTELSKTQMRRSEIMQVLSNHLQLAASEESSTVSAPETKTIATQLMNKASLSDLTLLDMPILKRG